MISQDPLGDLRERATTTVDHAGLVLGLSRTAAYAAVKRGDIPTIRIGRRLIVPTAPLLAMLEGRAVTEQA